MPRRRVSPTEVISPETKAIHDESVAKAKGLLEVVPGKRALDEQREVFRERQAAYLKAMQDVVTLDEWVAITRKAVEDARDGNNQARQWLSYYLLGKPVQRRDGLSEGGGGQTTIALLRMNLDDL